MVTAAENRADSVEFFERSASLSTEKNGISTMPRNLLYFRLL